MTATAWRRLLLRRPALAAAIAATLVVGPSVALEPPRLASLDDLDAMVAARIDSVWRAAAERPDEAARWFELGAVYQAHELTGLAADCYREAVRLDPESARAHYLLAHAERELGAPERAVEHLRRVIELAPGYPPARWRRGLWLLELGELETARRELETAVELAPEAAVARVGLAEIALAQSRPERAVELLRAALADEPAHGRAAQLLGAALRRLGREEEARRILAAAAGAGGENPDPWLEEMLARATGVGNILRRLSGQIERGVVEPAIRELTALRRDHPGHVGLLNKLAEALLARGRPEAALEALTEALEADPEEFATLIHLAQAERMRGDGEAALRWANRAVLANPRLWHAHFERAGLLCAASRWRECLAALDVALERGGHPSADVWLLRGEAYLQVGDWQAAATTFESATRRFPHRDQAFVGLAYARAEQGRLTEAAAALDRAAELAPEAGIAAALRARLAELRAAGGGDGG